MIQMQTINPPEVLASALQDEPVRHDGPALGDEADVCQEKMNIL
jgi:hypothetical protein